MKTIITLILMFAATSVFATHTSGLAAYRANQAAVAASVTKQGARISSIPSGYITRARRPNVINDPRSCVDRFGDYCVVEDHEPVELNLGDTNLSEYDVRVTKPE